MNGAESLVRTLIANDIDTCFANPGTSEMHFVAALDRVPGIRCALALFEGVATGAADGYARIAGKPAATLLHCGPGLANGLSNLHNARRARVPVVNIVGDHATYHRALDAPLTSDVEGWARPVSAWCRTSTRVELVGRDARDAVQAARAAPGAIATLVLPSDVCWNDGGQVAGRAEIPLPSEASPDAIETAARILRYGEQVALLLAGPCLRAAALADAHRIAAATGARLLAPTANARIERGLGRHPVERIPYAIDLALSALKGISRLILVGAPEPVGFFAYPGKPGRMLPPDAQVHVLSRPEQDGPQALARLADALAAPAVREPRAGERPTAPRGAITSETVGLTLAAVMPENAIIVDESVSFGRSFYSATRDASPHDWLQLTGGAIGEGLPLATGAAIAAPDRRVITMQADGSALYTVQALWTQARERLNVTTVILSNRKYAVLLGELANVGANPGRTALDMLDIGNPDLDWPAIANGFGIEAARATKLEQLRDLLSQSATRAGPFVIELAIG